MDKQLRKLCKRHMEAKHVKINAEKVPYLCEKLNIVTLPSVILVKNRKVTVANLYLNDAVAEKNISKSLSDTYF